MDREEACSFEAGPQFFDVTKRELDVWQLLCIVGTGAQFILVAGMVQGVRGGAGLQHREARGPVRPKPLQGDRL